MTLDCLGHNLNSYISAIKEFLLLLKLGISQIFSSAHAFRYHRIELKERILPRGDTKAFKCWGRGEEKQLIIKRIFVIEHLLQFIKSFQNNHYDSVR